MKRFTFNCWNRKFSTPQQGTEWIIEAETRSEAEEKAERTRKRLDRGNGQLEIELINEEEL